jgi:hypothetical protein
VLFPFLPDLAGFCYGRPFYALFNHHSSAHLWRRRYEKEKRSIIPWQHRMNIVEERSMLRAAASIILTFCCATPLVWLLSNLLVHGLRSFL